MVNRMLGYLLGVAIGMQMHDCECKHEKQAYITKPHPPIISPMVEKLLDKLPLPIAVVLILGVIAGAGYVAINSIGKMF